MAYQAIATLILAMIYDDAKFDTSDQGLFGFVAPRNAFVCLFYYSFLSGFWGLCGHTLSLFYFSPVFVMNSLMLEPLISQFLGIFLNIDKNPGIMTWLGLAIVLVSQIFIIKK